jgi:hypothetical protein
MNEAEQRPVTKVRRTQGGPWRIALGYLLPTPTVVGLSVLAVLIDTVVIKGQSDPVLCTKLAVALIFSGMLTGYFIFIPLNLVYTFVMEFAVNRRIRRNSTSVAISSGLGLICGFLMQDLWWLYILICPVAGLVTGLVLRRQYMATNPKCIDNQPPDGTR